MTSPSPEDEDEHVPSRETFVLNADCSITKITFNKTSRRQIQDVIQDNINYTFPVYCDNVGIAPPNFYAILNGTRQCTVEFLNKILSGINYQVSVETKLIVHPIETGPIAPVVDSIEPVQELPSNDGEEPDEYDSF